jgi:hypothetical protein
MSITPRDDPTSLDTSSDYVAPDWILSLLHDFCIGLDDTDATMALTVATGGLVISGLVVPYRRWRQRHLDKFHEGGLDQRYVAMFLSAFAHTDTEEAELRAQRDDLGLVMPDYRFLHMLDATIFSGSGPLTVSTWRGRMDSIDGWSLGSVQAA